MKRNELLFNIDNLILMMTTSHPAYEVRDVSETILSYIEDKGMLPPLSKVKIISDTQRPGFKHSESKREWDEE